MSDNTGEERGNGKKPIKNRKKARCRCSCKTHGCVSAPLSLSQFSVLGKLDKINIELWRGEKDKLREYVPVLSWTLDFFAAWQELLSYTLLALFDRRSRNSKHKSINEATALPFSSGACKQQSDFKVYWGEKKSQLGNIYSGGCASV